MPNQSENELFIIGIGASAGGIEAITHLLSSVEGKENCCFVIVQHLSPSYHSNLVTILQRNTPWDVKEIKDEMKPEPSAIYVTPPDRNVKIMNGLLLLEKGTGSQIAPSIDLFFSSLAEEKKGFAVGVILSGTGHDGSEGIEAIRKKGGYVICQVPSSGTSAGMPQSAIDTQQCDIILKPYEIFKEIRYYIRNYELISESKNDRSITKNNQDLILELLAERSGTDFSQYKIATITRRIEKRLEKLRKKDVSDYYQFIRNNPKELDELFQTVLIGITEFFRDKSAFERFKTILKQKYKDLKQQKTLRIWSVGCATGEEPYSLAILLLELIELDFPNLDFQIFATDLDERSLHIARNGLYLREKLKNIPKELIVKYFNEIPEGYEIKRRVRQQVLFTKHDITEDPPFIKLDMLVCRNLMIYFNTELQKDLLKLFNYSLVGDGLLFLGKSENIHDSIDLFEKVDYKAKIFIKEKGESHHFYRYTKHKKREKDNIPSSFKGQDKKELKLKDIVKETLLNTYEHPFVIINKQNKIREVYGSVRLFLELKDGDMNADIVEMMNPEMQLDIRAMLVKIKKEPKELRSRIIRFRVFDQEHFVRVRVKPLVYLFGKNEYFMVVFETPEIIPEYARENNVENKTDYNQYRIRELEEELAISKDHLQTFTEELESANEELQSMNEELQSANEELKTSNEELETSNEELQSANEELTTANNELKDANEAFLKKEEELKKANRDLEESEFRFRYMADHAPVMIWLTGPDMMGKYFNKRWQEFTGISLDTITHEKRQDFIHPEDVDNFNARFREAIEARSEFICEFRLRRKDGTFRWVLSRGVPRYSSNGDFLGYVGANSDIHDLKTLEEKKGEFISIAGHELKTPLTTAMAYLDLIREEIQETGNDQVKQYVSKMLRSTHKMNNLVTDLLEFSRLEAERMVFNLETIDFDPMVKEFVDNYSLISPARKIIISGRSGSSILGDKNRLEQVVTNLLSNADKFSEKGKKIHIKLGKEKNRVKMSVSDEGIGISKENHKNIFERFFQGNGGKYKSGMGVGLYITREIIKRHEGTIRVKSEIGKGSTFELKIPVKEEENE